MTEQHRLTEVKVRFLKYGTGNEVISSVDGFFYIASPLSVMPPSVQDIESMLPLAIGGSPACSVLMESVAGITDLQKRKDAFRWKHMILAGWQAFEVFATGQVDIITLDDGEIMPTTGTAFMQNSGRTIH